MLTMFRTFAIALISLITLNLNGQNLRSHMESSFGSFTEALKMKDPVKLKNALSTGSYMEMKNMMLSAKMPFPQTMFESVADYTLDFQKLQFLKAVENGPTGNLIYYDTEDENVILLKYVREDTKWKFSKMEISGNMAIIAKMKASDLSFLDDDKFVPSGVVPKTQQEVLNVDYVAMLDINGGYKIAVWVNGFAQEPTNGSSKSGLLMGGLKKGKNTIEIKLSPLDEPEGGTASVEVRAMIDGELKDVLLVESETLQSSIKKEFTVQ